MKIIYTILMVVRHVRIWLLGDSRWRGKDLWQVWCKEWSPYRKRQLCYHKWKQLRRLAYSRWIREVRAYHHSTTL